MHHRAPSTALATVLIFAVSACADILDLPDDPTLIAQGPWRCLQTQQEEPSPPQEETATVQVQVCNFVSTNCGTPVLGVKASLCDKKDVNCANPIRSGIVDTAGMLSFEVNTGGQLGTGFDGFLKISTSTDYCTNEAVFGPTASLLCEFAPECDLTPNDEDCRIPTFAPSLLFFNPPIRRTPPVAITLPLVPTSAFPALAAAAGARLDPSKGNIFITALDCDGSPAAGVSYDIIQYQNMVTELYIDNGVVSDTASETDRSGIGGFLGVPAGFAEVTGFLNGPPPMHMGKIGVQAAPFTITYSALVPSL